MAWPWFIGDSSLRVGRDVVAGAVLASVQAMCRPLMSNSMMSDRGNSFNSGDAEFQRMKLLRQRLEGVKDGTDQTVPFDEWAAEMLNDPDVRYRDNIFIAHRATVYERFEDRFLSSRLTIEELAQRAQVSPVTIKALLDRRAMPRRDALERLSIALGASAAFFPDADDR